MMKKIIALVLVGLMNISPALAQYGAQNSYGGESGGGDFYQAPTLRGSATVTIAPGTPVEARLNNTLSTAHTRVGETATATVDRPVYAGNSMAIPPGSILQLQVVDVRQDRSEASIDLRVVSATTPDGRRVPLQARVDKFRVKTSATRSLGKTALKQTAVGAGTGALAGTALGPLGGGGVGRGAIFGTAVGAGLGLLNAGFRSKAEDVVLSAGQSISFITDSPTQVQVSNSAPPPPAYGGGYQGGYQQAPQGGGYQGGYGSPPPSNGGYGGGQADPGYQYR